MSNISSILKERRIAAGYDLDEISDELKIRKKYLIAIEDGNFEITPGFAYLHGYIRLYAKYLNVRLENDFVQALNEQNAKNHLDQNAKDITTEKHSTINKQYQKYFIIISTYLLFIILIIYYGS